MATTSFATGNALTFKQQFSGVFAFEAANFDPLEVAGIMGEDENSAIQKISGTKDGLTDGGDSVTYSLSMKLTGSGTDGDDVLEGNEESLTFYSDSVKIDQKRFGVRLAGRMTEQRTKINLRKTSTNRLAVQAAEWKAELTVTMLAGKLGSNRQILPAGFTGFGGNTLTDVDSDHLGYSGSATSKADLASTDKFTRGDLAKMRAKAKTLSPKVRPLKIKGKDYYIVLLHPDVVEDLKASTTSLDWGDIQKAMLQGGQDPKMNGLINSSLGILDGCILVEYELCPIYTDYGAGSNVRASRVLFLGAQAGVYVKGKYSEGVEWDYVEKTFDMDNQVAFAVGTICGVKPTIFNAERYGMLAWDCAAAAN